LTSVQSGTGDRAPVLSLYLLFGLALSWRSAATTLSFLLT